MRGVKNFQTKRLSTLSLKGFITQFLLQGRQLKNKGPHKNVNFPMIPPKHKAIQLGGK
jgi:hypothetical protein